MSVTEPVDIVLPVRGQLHFTRSIVSQLLWQLGDDDRIWIFDNGSEDDTPAYLRHLVEHDDRVVVYDAAGWAFYMMWDQGIWGAWATRELTGGAHANVLVINNDIVISPNLLTRLVTALRVDERHWIAYPNYDRRVSEGEAPQELCTTAGTYRHGGMAGHCFMIAAERIDWEPLVDPPLKWWGGDDVIAFKVEERGGLQVRDVGLPLDHVNEGTASHHELDFQKAEDLAYIVNVYGR